MFNVKQISSLGRLHAHVVHSVKPVNASDKTFKPNSKMIFNVRLYCFDTGGGFILGFG